MKQCKVLVDWTNWKKRYGLATILSIALTIPAAFEGLAAGETKAFPTAEGFGAFAKGGRGGAVYEVTNLDDSGEGSLRACVEAKDPRTCVFRVGGTINLASSLVIRDPFITIAGQTAPGDGITLRNLPNNQETPLVVLDTHDVIIRFLRSRPGPSAQPSSNLDALEVLRGSERVIIDHVSLSWSVDELFSTYPERGRNPSDVTLQWSLLAEGLSHSNHATSKSHSKGILLVSGKGGEGAHRFSLHHNLLAHSRDRMPELAVRGFVEYVNNVMYNAASEFGEFWNDYGPMAINFIGNVTIPGPNTRTNIWATNVKINEPAHPVRLYLADNLTMSRPGDRKPRLVDPNDEETLVKQPDPRATLESSSATPDDTLRDVLAMAGAKLPTRDAVDERIIHEVKTRSGKIINHPDEVGGWPVIRNGEPEADGDHDGMPDQFELQMAFDPDNPEDRNGDHDGDGYTNLEHYLNSLTGEITLAPPE